jgi:transposase
MRKISETEEQAYRLVHHEFGGLSKDAAAEFMGITVQALNRLLAAVQRIAPQLFPILTREQARVKNFYDQGLSIDDIAKTLEIKERRVQTILGQLRDLEVITFVPKTLMYGTHLDDKIVERF